MANGNRDLLGDMDDPFQFREKAAFERALRHVEQALDLSDALGYTFASLDLCAAAEKIKAAMAHQADAVLLDPE